MHTLFVVTKKAKEYLNRMAMLRFLVVGLLLMMSCTNNNRSVDIYSYTIKNRNEKFKILKEYVSIDPGLIDAEYHIWYKDNSGGMVPGPSSYHFTLAYKIIPDSLSLWTKGLELSSEQIPSSYWDKLRLDKKWALSSKPDCYFSNSRNYMVVYKKEGIILAHYSAD